MSVLDQSVVIDVHVQQLIASVGIFADAAGKGDAAAHCAAIAGAHDPSSTFPLRIRLDALLVGMIDAFRDAGQSDLVDKMERVIAALKAGEPQRLIVGSVDFDVRSIGELDDRLEQVHLVGARAFGG